ncbi:MAG: phage capsid protein [Ruminococcaceae bacterium]|jgi:hypothetical protein|nr:phage capsid protein [Oscillospiraceae bacterium]
MLTPDYLDHCTDDVVDLYSELENRIVADIARRLLKTGYMTDTAAYQASIVQQSGLLYADVVQRVSKLSGLSAKQVRAMFEDAATACITGDNRIYIAAGKSPSVKLSPAAYERLKAAVSKTAGDLQNLTMTTASSAQAAYIQAATQVEMQVSSGAFDYNTAFRMAVKQAAEAGCTVSYPSGHVDKLDVAIRRAGLTGVNQTAAEISLMHADDMECDLVETTAHSGARPTHAIWQGRVFSRSGRNGDYDDFESATGYGTGAGLCGWNCRHNFFPYFEGLSSSAYPRDAINRKNNAKISYDGDEYSYYDATQIQRSMERKIRATKREMTAYDAAGQREDFASAASKLKAQREKLNDFCKETGLLRQDEREQVLGYSHSQATKAAWAARRTE